MQNRIIAITGGFGRVGRAAGEPIVAVASTWPAPAITGVGLPVKGRI
ncbi:MAG: hypothetical protein AAGA48_26120 [Myxococcota bacterium]